MLPWWPALGRWPWLPGLCPHWFQRRKKKKTGEGRAAEENISLLVSQKVDYKGNKDSGFICMGAYLVNLKYF